MLVNQPHLQEKQDSFIFVIGSGSAACTVSPGSQAPAFPQKCLHFKEMVPGSLEKTFLSQKTDNRPISGFQNVYTHFFKKKVFKIIGFSNVNALRKAVGVGKSLF